MLLMAILLFRVSVLAGFTTLLLNLACSVDDQYANRIGFMARDEIASKPPPGGLRIANANSAGKPVDCYGKLHPIFENFVCQRFRDFDAAEPAVVPARAIGDVGRAFQEDAALPALAQDITTRLLAQAGASVPDIEPT